MKVLITGIAGFIGFHTAKVLRSAGYGIVGVDDLNDNMGSGKLKTDRLEQLGVVSNGESFTSNDEGLVFYKVDISEADQLSQVFYSHGFDAVIHLAAQAGVRYSLEEPQACIKSNLIGFSNVLEACRRFEIGHLIYASSSSVYGNSTEVPFREVEVDYSPISLYAATKQSNEHMAYSYSHIYGMRTTGLRFFTVYGPWGRKDMAYTLFAERMLAGLVIKVFNYGDQYRDFTYIDDVTKVFPAILQKKNWEDSQTAPASVFNIGNSSPVQLLDFIRTLENVLGVKARKELVEGLKVDVVRTYADIGSARKAFGFEPTCDLETGLRKFADWYISYRAEDKLTSTQSQLS